jgi:hypothetical protein
MQRLRACFESNKEKIRMLKISRRQILVVIGLIAVLSASIIYAQTDWLVSTVAPAIIGVQVASGTHSNNIYPEVSWQAPTGGQLQTVFWDNDPKCGEVGALLEIERPSGTESYPVPTAPFKTNGDCTDPVDLLYSSRSFGLDAGDVANGDTRDDSGRIEFNFATNTPIPTSTSTDTPTATATETPTPTNTALPTETSTPTNTPSPTDTATPTATSTETATATPTETPEVPVTQETATPTSTPTETSTPTATAVGDPEPPEPTGLEIEPQPQAVYEVRIPWSGK